MFEFEYIKEAFFILLVVLGVVFGFISVLGIIGSVVEKDIELVVTAVIVLVLSVLFIFGGLSCFEAPPDTIEKDGYTYTLYEEPPEEFIEYNGHTYRLGDSVNE